MYTVCDGLTASPSTTIPAPHTRDYKRDTRDNVISAYPLAGYKSANLVLLQCCIILFNHRMQKTDCTYIYYRD